ncbi:MAG TPA: hypothetical protein VGM64_12860 [Lacunisphaera sp.]|jgi:hypothetical protein
MTTPQQVLFDLNVARRRAEEEEQKWIKLRRECQAPAVLGITWVIGFLLLCIIGMLEIRAGDWKDCFALFAPAMFMACGVMMAFQRKQKALMKVIEAEAPELSMKLKIKGIA